ncbi:outer membrane beta-barrel protein [Rhodoferax sp.]|uniref:outer membrane beta-barrel protein n=1 Tax=Rhodoferax sp. TaxID=50421 RepID=UPI00271F397D|nr:outer membrane beta-barrel protein [Rhodoferax sp.]MDO9143460.1 outer membrane beta-barrel protein [Rhodoferax sp.]MDP3863260.1 outer membrane beta-barrel protein [Rhodoferax sp.]
MSKTPRQYFRSTGKLSLLTLALMAAPFAMAQDAGWYAGANIGQTRSSLDNASISNSLLGATPPAITSISEDNSDRGYKLFGGYQINKYLALEGGYFDLGQFDFVTNTNAPSTLNGNIQVRGVNLDAVGILPITDKFSAFGRLGVTHAHTKGSFAGATTVNSTRASDNNLKVGLGVQYAFTDALSLRAEIERYRINDSVGQKGDIDMASVGLVYRFGGKTPTPVAQTYAPAPVIIAQAPAPVYVAPPPPAPTPIPAAMPQRVSFSADSLFDFDSAAVKPTGRAELDKLAANLRGVDFDVIQVTGHTDRIGRQAYNLKLSTQRAEAVGNYLVSAAGIPASKISTRGVNGADPVTKPGECVGTKVTPALIACLQPDRRVDIEVTGQR